DYEWLLLELFDQMTREQSGGDMRAYLHRSAIPNKDFICERIGEVGRQIMTASQRPLETSFPLRPSLVNRAVKWALRPRQVVRWLAIRFLLLPEDRRALEIGSFRRSGEVHHWLNDSHSLSQIVLEAGFGPPVVQSATTSQIPNWATYGLDSNAEGVIYKPDSIFMEAVKPG
ncbi:MAG: methyltransferase type 11, partial [Verrucomicrobia bacterium]|nr:methyltransferase type 11 [Verrucomicrobiota bacterium]